MTQPNYYALIGGNAYTLIVEDPETGDAWTQTIWPNRTGSFTPLGDTTVRRFYINRLDDLKELDEAEFKRYANRESDILEATC